MGRHRARYTTDALGTVLPAGSRTIENRFNFHSSRARIGSGHAFPVNRDSTNTVMIDGGLAIYTIGYGLRQTNNMARTTREQAERWAEVTQSLGIRFRSRDFELSFAFRRSCGNQGCGEGENRGIMWAGGDVAMATAGGIIAAPGAPLFIQSGTETAHRFMVMVPIW